MEDFGQKNVGQLLLSINRVVRRVPPNPETLIPPRRRKDPHGL
jgi:hypothetical protein